MEEIFVVVVVPSLLFFLVALVNINLLYPNCIPSIGTLVFTEGKDPVRHNKGTNLTSRSRRFRRHTLGRTGDLFCFVVAIPLAAQRIFRHLAVTESNVNL